MVRDDEHARLIRDRSGQRGEEAADETIDVLERPVGLRRARPVEVLEAIDAAEVDEEQVGLVPPRHVRRDAADHLVLVKALGKLGPLALPVQRVAGRAQLFPHAPRSLRLEHALVLEERQIEVERGRVACGGPVNGRRPKAGSVSQVVDGRRAQESGRVVDGIARQVLRLERAAVQDVVGDHAKCERPAARHQAHVGRLRGAREHGLHAGSQHTALREPTEHRQARGRPQPRVRRTRPETSNTAKTIRLKLA